MSFLMVGHTHKDMDQVFSMSFLMVGHTHEDIEQVFSMSFLMVGHTHEDIDQVFSMSFLMVGHTHKGFFWAPENFGSFICRRCYRDIKRLIKRHVKFLDS